ncbi:MAG TPA: metallophosphoesterase family protein [Oligoflexia bacterium]|nr:metallophosphoesterase family protein [Oligoflexia bacterium]HMP27668.1 metallophosphoesterase family protein [Oligoflexia bacterium]
MFNSNYFRKISLPQSGRIFAIGDIHGCVRELEILLEGLVTLENLGKEDLVVFIGDYIDRGPAVKETVETLINFKLSYPNAIFLRGNHEDMFLDYLGLGGGLGEFYIDNDGDATLKSYGISIFEPGPLGRDRLPFHHLNFFKELETGIECGDYLFVHAGLDPARNPENQLLNDLLWVRDSFIPYQHDFGKTIVFGHTPFEDIFFDLPYKIGIDTGLVYGNKLSCLELDSKIALQIGSQDNKIKKISFVKE